MSNVYNSTGRVGGNKFARAMAKLLNDVQVRGRSACGPPPRKRRQQLAAPMTPAPPPWAKEKPASRSGKKHFTSRPARGKAGKVWTATAAPAAKGNSKLSGQQQVLQRCCEAATTTAGSDDQECGGAQRHRPGHPAGPAGSIQVWQEEKTHDGAAGSCSCGGSCSCIF